VFTGAQSDEAERYIAPTLLDFGTDLAAFKASECMADELFGPLTPIAR
jgi:hypothetical protein